MDVVALVAGREHPSTRYRVAGFADAFRSAGMNLRIEPIARQAADRLRQVTQCRSGQIVLIQRKLLPIWQVMLLRRSARLLVYDFDDAVFLRDSFHARGPYSLTRLARFQATIALADVVLAGNKYLADHVLRSISSRKVEVIPTCVDTGRYKLAEHKSERATRMVWIGSSSTLQSLEQARGLLEHIGERVPRTRLRVICDRFPRFRHLNVEAVRWTSDREAEDLRRGDIGISWLADDPWNRGKCGLKVLQYMAAGLPVIASPVGVHCDFLNEEHGVLASSPRDWTTHVRRLSNDRSLRRQMGQAARACAERQFDATRWGSIVAERLLDAASP